MSICPPKNVKNQEYRVGITPASVRELTSYGHSVLVQSVAGEPIGLTDAQYQTRPEVDRPRQLDLVLGERISTAYSCAHSQEAAVPDGEPVIRGVLISCAAARKLVALAMASRIKRKGGSGCGDRPRWVF